MTTRSIGGSELENIVDGLSASGLAVVHIFQDGTPLAATLVPAFRELSVRGSPFSHFYEMDIDETDQAVLDQLGVVSLPAFVVVGKADYPHDAAPDPPVIVPGWDGVQIVASASVSTIDRLEVILARIGVL